MKKTTTRKLSKAGSTYIQVKRDGKDVIRVSGHVPNPARLLTGRDTRDCKNIYLIFVKNMIDDTRENGAELAKLIRLKESIDPDERKSGEKGLNNLLAVIGEKVKKGMAYTIIEAKSDSEVNKTVNEIKNALKTTVFAPLTYIFEEG